MTPQEFKDKLKEYGITQKAFAENVLGIKPASLLHHLHKERVPKFIEDAFTLHLLALDGVEIGEESITIKRRR